MIRQKSIQFIILESRSLLPVNQVKETLEIMDYWPYEVIKETTIDILSQKEQNKKSIENENREQYYTNIDGYDYKW